MAHASATRKVRLSDPHAELPIKNHKGIKNCTELYLANKRIEQIANFDTFVNLEVLWINGNQIQNLDGLDTCVRLKQLFVQNNCIRSLEGSSLLHFKFLQELRLYDNKLKDLQGTLDVLSRLPHLQDLDLFGNAVVEEENYRLQVIRAIPSLHVLDRHVVTDQERLKASRLQLHRDEDGDVHHRQTKNKKRQSAVVAGAPPQALSGTVKMLFQEVAAIKREQLEQAREAAKRDQELTRSHLQTVSSTSKAAVAFDKKASPIPNVDYWEAAALKKHFHSLEATSNSGVSKETLALVFRYLRARGFAVFCAGIPLEETANAQIPFEKLLPQSDSVQWRQLLQLFETNQLRCELMPPQELRQLAAQCFDKCAALQRRLHTLSPGDPKAAVSLEIGTVERASEHPLELISMVPCLYGQQLVKESHELSQQGYHHQALADNEATSGRSSSSRVPSSANVSHNFEPSTVRTPRTRFYMTTFSSEKTSKPSAPRDCSSKFHELKAESAQIDEALASKYKIRQKDFTKYLHKQSPPTTKLVRRNYAL